MSALDETAIWMALRSAFAAFAGRVPVAWPLETFEPTLDVPFYAVAFTAAPPRRVLLARGAHIRDGFLTVSHVAPQGQPLEWHMQKAAEIVAAFPEDRWLEFDGARVRITRRGEIMPPYSDGPYMRTPIVIPWQAFA